VLGYLRNQRLIQSRREVDSVTVDWDVGRRGRAHARMGSSTSRSARRKRVVTTGCGQGTVFGDLLDHHRQQLPGRIEQARIRQSTLHRMLETMRQQDSIHRKAGSVHGCALFRRAGRDC
jgi:FdhD protein